ncbi:MAG: acyl-CoA synthetase [Spirosomataceae bacterium]
MLPIIQQAHSYLTQTAIYAEGKAFSYGQLMEASQQFAYTLLHLQPDLYEARVAFMITPGFDYVRVQWAIWQAGGVAVPLCTTHPLPSLRYVIEDTQAAILVVSNEFAPLLQDLAAELRLRFIVLGSPEPSAPSVSLPKLELSRRAMILYTSGTTSLPKGVVTTHANLSAQIRTLVQAWEYARTDHILCVLPLHHVHGIINVISCTLWAGGAVTFLPSFSAQQVFDTFLQKGINVFMAVPTIYFKLIAHVETLSEAEQQQLLAHLKTFRLMVSGSAALPISVMEKWEKISGHRLLERYGMTEIGMAISNPYHGERRAGAIGMPLPGVSVRLVNEHNQPVASDEAGEIQVKGDNVFKEYWNRPEATAKSFTEDGWFMTGDTAVIEDGYFRILGRTSMDIIKSGGYKISALEIEEVLRSHPEVSDCAVVGIPNEEWGELVAAAVIVKNEIDSAFLTQFLRERMPAYRVPRRYAFVQELPRNAMGKVTKNDIKRLFEA